MRNTLISAGILLLLGTVFATNYTVKSGDTLSSVAQKNNITLLKLAALNPNASNLVVGQTLRLSGKPKTAVQSITLEGVAKIVIPKKVQQGTAFRVAIFEAPPVGASKATQPIRVEFLDQAYQTQEDVLLSVPRLQSTGVFTLKVSASAQSAEATIKVVALDTDKQKLNINPQMAKRKAERVRIYQACLNNAGVPYKPVWQNIVKASQAITTRFGQLRSYNGAPFNMYHEGLDFGTMSGTAVYAPAPAKVVLKDNLAIRGKTLALQHGTGVCSVYAHLSKTAVSVGQTVQTGQLIGYTGNTGASTGAHLHFEIRVHGVPVNPLPWFLSTP